MSTHGHSAEAILATAIELTDPAARPAYLDRTCVGDAGLRQEVESLLAAHDAAARGVEDHRSSSWGWTPRKWWPGSRPSGRPWR
jgi:hypothetical protein